MLVVNISSYVCYTKDESLPPISDVTVIYGESRTIYPDAQYVRIDQDCNESARGSTFIYVIINLDIDNGLLVTRQFFDL